MLRLALVLCILAGPLSAAVEVILNRKAASPGDDMPAEVSELPLRNGLVSITFGGDGSAMSLVKNGRELAHNLHGIVPRDNDAHRTWYIDYNAGGGHLVADVIRVVKATPDIAHIAIIDSGETSAFYLEHHILLMNGENGLYGYVICKNPKNRRLGGEMLSMYRLDRDIFDWAYVSERTGHQPRYAELVKYPTVQDETWEMPDGSIYRKYDYAGYMAENPMWGYYGHGFGVWFMPVGAEYYAGGNLRRDLMVHQDALILNYFQGAHYAGVSGNPRLTISVKGKEIKPLSYANDAATYRAALRSARYQLEDIGFPADLLVKCGNTVRFGMTAVGKNGGIMYDTIKLEIE